MGQQQHQQLRRAIRHCLLGSALCAVAAATIPAAYAQQPAAAARPADKPPVAQAWIDVATYATPGMPGGMAGMMMGGGGGSPMSALFGGGGGAQKGNQFGNTKAASSGSFVDVTLRTNRNPNLAEATQAVPPGTKLSPTLNLHVLPQAKPLPGKEDEPEPAEIPKFRIKLYWGCGAAVRPGQPKVLDSSSMTNPQMAEIFQGRRATQRGTHAAPGRPVWPNPQDPRMVPPGSSFAGEHTYTGEGVPDGFKFTVPPAQDIMPPIALQQADNAGVTHLTWQPVPNARGYFIAAMGGRGEEKGGSTTAEVTLWTSSELPDSGSGLIDYQTNKAVDQWLKDKVLLAPTTTSCDVPKGIFSDPGSEDGTMGMLRMIAYGTELNLAYPPRPTDPKVAWEPDWAVKIRVKSVAMAMLGMPSMDGGDAGSAGASSSGGQVEDGSGTGGEGEGAAPTEQPKKKKKFGLMDAIDAVKDAVPH